jgi:hypothetical protein
VRAQEQPNDYDCCNCDDRPDNFLCRHSAPIDSWTRNLEHMLPRDRSYQRIRASIIQYMCRRESVSRANADGMNEHG